MKTLLLSSLLLLSAASYAQSTERNFQCEARYLFGQKEKAALSGTITSPTSLADVVYSIDEQPEFNSVLVTIDKSSAKKYAYYQKFSIDDGAYALFMPEKMDSAFHFTAIVENGKTSEKLECVIAD